MTPQPPDIGDGHAARARAAEDHTLLLQHERDEARRQLAEHLAHCPNDPRRTRPQGHGL